jgi:hypothetical protein
VQKTLRSRLATAWSKTFGRSATRFHPDDATTRGEAVVMLIRWVNSFEQA